MNGLFSRLNGGNQSGMPNFGNPQMQQQFTNFVQNLDTSRNTPQQMVQQLLNTGRMSPQQFEQFRQMANQFTGKKY